MDKLIKGIYAFGCANCTKDLFCEAIIVFLDLKKSSFSVSLTLAFYVISVFTQIFKVKIYLPS